MRGAAVPGTEPVMVKVLPGVADIDVAGAVPELKTVMGF